MLKVNHLNGFGSRPYSQEALALFAQMTTPPSNARRRLIDNTINSLKSAGIWQKLDALWVWAAETSQAGRLNWKSPTTFTSTEVNSPTFTADRGYAGNGSNSYINTTWAPSGGVNLTQNSACIFGWCLTSRAGSNFRSIGAAQGSFSGYLGLAPRWGDGVFYGNINASSGAAAGAIGASNGLFSGSRSSSTAVDLYRNGSSVLSTSVTSEALTSSTIYMGGLNLGGSLTDPGTDQFALLGVSSALNATENLSLYNTMNSYLTAVGAV